MYTYQKNTYNNYVVCVCVYRNTYKKNYFSIKEN